MKTINAALAATLDAAELAERLKVPKDRRRILRPLLKALDELDRAAKRAERRRKKKLARRVKAG
mgnify:CR=1 FL=1